MPDSTSPLGAALPPPSPPGTATPLHEPPPALPLARPTRHPMRGQLTTAWRAMVVTTWVGAFVAYMAVWKASEELGLATWWLGPRSDPRPIIVRLVPFMVTAVFGILASYNVPRMPIVGLVGAAALAAIAVPDLSRSVGLATIEFTIAAAVLLVASASFTGAYRQPTPHGAG